MSHKFVMKKFSSKLSVVIQPFHPPNPIIADKTPYFYPGDHIVGTIKYENAAKKLAIRHRGIYVKLCACVFKKGQIIETKTITTVLINDGGSIMPPFSMDFSIATAIDLSPTFKGRKFSYGYIVMATVQKTLKHIDAYAPINIVTSMKELPQKPPLRFSISTEQLSGRLNFEQGCFSNNSVLDGTFTVTDIKNNNIESLFIQLITIEAYKEKFSRPIHLDYQFVDGCPRPEVAIPVSLDIRNLHLWGPTNQKYFNYNGMYALRINVKGPSGREALSKEIPLEIYFIEENPP